MILGYAIINEDGIDVSKRVGGVLNNLLKKHPGLVKEPGDGHHIYFNWKVWGTFPRPDGDPVRVYEISDNDEPGGNEICRRVHELVIKRLEAL